MKSGFMLFSSS